MTFNPNLTPGQRLDNKEVMMLFGCGNSGGMRRASRTSSLVLFSDHAKSLYEDRWDENNLLHYTGEGQKGDQTLTRNNKTLLESSEQELQVFFFERFTGKGSSFVYIGEVKLVGQPYQESQLDTDDHLRKVWVFPLKLVSDGPVTAFNLEDISFTEKERKRQTKKLSDKDLVMKLIQKPKNPSGSPRTVSSYQYPRDPLVVEYALRRAQGHCDLCEEHAPFLNKGGEPYLEVHHVDWLSKGGPDTIDNVTALCPNCHRKMHSLNEKMDRIKLKKKASKKLKDQLLQKQ